MTSDRILGIDLGTTNSAFAILEGGEPEIIVNSEGDRTTPSVVMFEDDGSTVVGQPAKNQLVKEPERCVKSIKRHMGEEDYSVDIDGESYTPEQISAEILRKIKEDAEEYFGEEIERCVITVPAYFNDKERKATENAGKIAGFDVERIVNEPTAAAMAYGMNESGSQKILVYDLGGGTFDVTVLEMSQGVYEVVSTSGDNELGGDDWTEELIDYTAEKFLDENGVDIREDVQSLQRLTEECEKTKMSLSSRKQANVTLPYIAQSDSGPLNLDMEITRSKFESLTEDLVSRTRDPVNKALDEADLDKSDIDRVVLVGGSTRMPMIKKEVESMLDADIMSDVNPDEAVSLGAAVQAGILDDKEHGSDVDDIVLLDVTPLSLGVEKKGGLFETIIDSNTTIPAENSKLFTTAEDNQTDVSVRVFQGERDIAEKNELLGDFSLTGIQPAPAGEPRIEVTFEINADGIVEVSAVDLSTNKSENITVEGGTGLSDEEVERMRREADKNKEKDRRRRMEIEAENEADKVIRLADKALNESQKIPNDLVEKINTQQKEVEELKNGYDDFKTLEKACENLNHLVKEAGSYIH